MKKSYLTPEVSIMAIWHQDRLLVSSLSNINTNDDLLYSGGGDGIDRARNLSYDDEL